METFEIILINDCDMEIGTWTVEADDATEAVLLVIAEEKVVLNKGDKLVIR